VFYEVLRVSEQVSVILWSYHQRQYKTFCDCYYLWINYQYVLLSFNQLSICVIIFQSVINLCCAHSVCLCSIDSCLVQRL